MRLMQIHKPRNGYKPVSPQPFDFSRYAGRQSKLLMRTDVKRREIWEWSDHTRAQALEQQVAFPPGRTARWLLAYASLTCVNRPFLWPGVEQ